MYCIIVLLLVNVSIPLKFQSLIIVVVLFVFVVALLFSNFDHYFGWSNNSSFGLPFHRLLNHDAIDSVS